MKARDEAFARCKGLFNITMTPFRPDGALDREALIENIDRLLAIGYGGLLIGGTYGEFAAMSVSERADLFRVVMDRVGDEVPVLLCTAGSDVRDVRDLTTLAAELGGLPMLTPPFVSEVTEDQIVAFFEEISVLSPQGVVIYNAPGVGITLSPGTIERIAGLPQVVALKQGDLAPTSVDTLVGRLSGRLRLLVASDLVMPAPLALGFDGVSSTNSNALPELVHALYGAIDRGDLAAATRLHRGWYPLRECARKFGQPQTVKAAMSLRGFRSGTVRRPLHPVSASQQAEIRAALEQVARVPESGIGRLVGGDPA